MRTSERGQATVEWSGLLLAVRSQAQGRNDRTLDAEWAVGDEGYARWSAFLDQELRYRSVVLTPGIFNSRIRPMMPSMISPRPISQLSSRGLRNAPVKNTRNM